MGALCVLTSIPSSYWLRDVVSFALANPVKTPLASFFISVLLPLFYRGRIDQAIAQSERLFAAFMDNLPGFVWMKDLDGRYVYVNERVKRLAPHQNDWLGKTDAEIWPGEIAATFREKDLKVAASREALETLEPCRLDGQDLWVLVNRFPVFDDTGAVVMVGGAGVDMTERKLAEKALRETEEKYRSIFENAVEGIFRTTPDGRFVAANPALARMLGFDSPEELMSARTDIAQEHYVDPKSREEFTRSMEENGFVLAFEVEVYRKDGSKIWISENVRAVREEHGCVLYYEGTSEDITDRKRAEARGAAFANLAHKLSGAWIPLDAGRIIAESAYELFGWDSCTLDLYDAEHDVIHSMLNMDMIDGQRESVTPLVSGRRPTRRGKRVIDHGPELILREEPLKFDEDAVPFGDTSRPSATLMTAPIRHASRVIGILSFQSYTLRAYDDVAFSDLQALSDHCGEALNRLQAETQLQESEERYRDLVENSLDLICTHDLDGLILSANPAAMELMGYSSESYAGGTNFREILAPEVRDQFDDYLKRIRADGVASGLMLVQTKTGEKQIWEYHNTLRTQGVSAPIVRGMARDITERRRANHSLKLFRALIDRSSDAIEVIDPDTLRFLDCNESAYKDLGYSREEFLSLSVYDIAPTTVDERMKERLDREMDRSGFVMFETVHQRKDGSTFPVEVNLKTVRLEKDYSLAVVRDITERKAAEEALRQAERKYRDIFENAIEGIFQIRSGGGYISANPALARMLGFSSSEELIRERSDPSKQRYVDPRRREEYIRLLTEEGMVRDFEYEDYRKDGSTIWLSDNVHAVHDSEGPLLYYEGTTQDITARKLAEQALRESEERYRELFENAKNATYVHDLSGRYTSVNRAAEKLTGYTRAEILGKEFTHFVPPEQLEGIREYFCRKLIDEGETSYETEVVTKDGRRVAVEVNSHLIFENGVAIGVQGTARDITERKAAEEKLKASSEQLRALSARLQSAREEEGTRIAREIHDVLGSVLTSLKWDLEGTDRILVSPMEPWQFAALREKLHALMKLTDLAISAIRRIASELRPSVLDDLGLVAAIEWQAQQFQARAGIVCYCDRLLEKVELSEEQSTAVFRILQEALTNVLLHAQATKVDIKITKENGHFTLSISDNGKGISESEKSEQQSLGILGMRERAHLVGGEIDIKGVEGKGTVVIIRVPISGQDRVLKMKR